MNNSPISQQGMYNPILNISSASFQGGSTTYGAPSSVSLEFVAHGLDAQKVALALGEVYLKISSRLVYTSLVSSLDPISESGINLGEDMENSISVIATSNRVKISSEQKILPGGVDPENFLREFCKTFLKEEPKI